MKYKYKTVSLGDFIHNIADEEKLISANIFSAGGQIANQVTAMIEYLLNYYAEDEWEFWRVEHFNPQIFKSVGAVVANALFKIGDGDEQGVPVLIFRKEITPESLAREAEETAKRFQLEEKKKNDTIELERQRIASRVPAKCPQCGGSIFMDTEACNHCNAWLGGGSNQKPLPV